MGFLKPVRWHLYIESGPNKQCVNTWSGLLRGRPSQGQRFLLSYVARTTAGCAKKHLACFRADSRFAPSQWETALLCIAVSHWLGANLSSALYLYAHNIVSIISGAFWIFISRIRYTKWRESEKILTFGDCQPTGQLLDSMAHFLSAAEQVLGQ